MSFLLLLGFLIGMRHALEADHVAAVASLASKTISVGSAVKQGAAWGLGHTITLFLFSTIVIMTDSIVPEKFANGLEFIVGIMLIFLGGDVIRRLIRDKIHFHSHQHDNEVTHFHAHKHANNRTNNQTHSDSAHRHEHASGFPIRALYVGLMHGMAGSAALIILTLQSVDSVATGLFYILMFGIGSIVGMAALSVIIAIPLHHSAKGLTWINNGFQVVIGITTIALGSTLIYDIGIPFI
jgi:ABC-type nickel/cobalt efflux system permease component RcnA